jgi:hypothetical protein
MADVQALFEQFHQNIRTYYEINETLREKKDIIVRRVKAHLAKNRRPTCQEYLQGSYKMKVGICALDGAEFDIDVGLRFSFDEAKYSASEVRDWVFEAVDGHTEDVDAKGPCIRVTYKDGYHVDLVSYAWWDDALGIEQHRLAHRDDGWRPADPPKLVQWVLDARAPFADTKDTATQTDQFRRVVRYLKRWNDHAIRGESPDKPSGLALVLLVKEHLSTPALTWAGAADDRLAVEHVARSAADTVGRISACKPTPEYEDMYGRLSNAAMTKLKERFGKLRDAVVDAGNATDPKVACKRLREVFGDDFPCPDAEKRDTETAMRTSAPAVVPSSSSAA